MVKKYYDLKVFYPCEDKVGEYELMNVKWLKIFWRKLNQKSLIFSGQTKQIYIKLARI